MLATRLLSTIQRRSSVAESLYCIANAENGSYLTAAFPVARDRRYPYENDDTKIHLA